MRGVREYLSKVWEIPFFPRVQTNTTGASSEAETGYPSGATEFKPVFSGLCVAQSLILCA
jgi:hypothetical protein